MQQIERVDFEDGNYEFQYGIANQKSYSKLNGQLYVEVSVIPDILSVSGYGGVNRFESKRASVFAYLHCLVCRW